MDRETKKAFGLIMGDLYEIKSLLKKKPIDKAKLFALQNGFEHEIDEQLDVNFWISLEEKNKIDKILDPYFRDETLFNNLKGYYDIEPLIEEAGISRLKAIVIMKYFYERGPFRKVLDKMDSSDSPQECRKLDIDG